KLDPTLKPQRSVSPTSETKAPKGSTSAQPRPPKTQPRQSIPAAIRRQVWQRDQGVCRYQDPQTGRKCQSSYQLQTDHIQPLARNGETAPENLQLLCAFHNRLKGAS